MDFLPLILVILLAVGVVVYFVRRNPGTKHAGNIRPDRQEASVIAGDKPDGDTAVRSEDRGQAS